MNIWDEIKKDAAGFQILKDWLGDDARPVCQENADHRSLACIRGNNGEPCPHNKSPNWWQKNINQPVAQAIKDQVELKGTLSMTTPLEEHLNMCEVCGCFLALKIHVPISHIMAHTPAEKLASYPSYCWIRKEIESRL